MKHLNLNMFVVDFKYSRYIIINHYLIRFIVGNAIEGAITGVIAGAANGIICPVAAYSCCIAYWKTLCKLPLHAGAVCSGISFIFQPAVYSLQKSGEELREIVG